MYYFYDASIRFRVRDQILEPYRGLQDTDIRKYLYSSNMATVVYLKLLDIEPLFTVEKLDDEQIVYQIIRLQPRAIHAVENPTEEMQLLAISKEPLIISLIRNATEQVKHVAVTENWHAIKWINDPSEALLLLAISKNVHAMGLIKNPTEKIQRFALAQYGACAIPYIHNPLPFVWKTEI